MVIDLSILEKIHSGEDVRKLSYEELSLLCSEIRGTIIETVSENGGHLSSNLGAVELTVAIHRVYDSGYDRILFDVGHQSYAHKLLTGRFDRFHSIRQTGGLSGFPSPLESPDDAFIAGHASTSVSLALGMAKARTILGKDYNIVSVIGDGALTGGLAYEGLTNAALSGEPLVIIINDNNMSIDNNVGGIANILQHMRTKPAYLSLKKRIRNSIMKYRDFYHAVHEAKEKIKAAILPSNLFIDMGFEYLGPIDGHDIKELEEVLRKAKDLNRPVVVHVLTIKGKGYKPAENDPDIFHGVGQFDPLTGSIRCVDSGFSDKLGESLCSIAQENRSVVAITAAMSLGTGLERFKKIYPDRFFDVGIAEGHAVTFAAALAKQGITPVFAVYSSFLQRGFDMLLHDVSILNLHVVFCIDRAGLVGPDGITHHGVFDLAYCAIVPNLKVYSCSSYTELHDMLYQAVNVEKGPVVVRFSKGGEGAYKGSGIEDEKILRPGKDITFATYGTQVNEMIAAAEQLMNFGVSAEIVKINTIQPNDFPVTLESLRKTRRLLTAEDVCAESCIGNRILLQAQHKQISLANVDLINLGNGLVPHGSLSDLKKKYGLDSTSIVERVLNMNLKNDR